MIPREFGTQSFGKLSTALTYISYQDDEHDILGRPEKEPIYTEVLEDAPGAAQPTPPLVEGRDKQAVPANATPGEAVDATAKRTPDEAVAAAAPPPPPPPSCRRVLSTANRTDARAALPPPPPPPVSQGLARRITRSQRQTSEELVALLADSDP